MSARIFSTCASEVRKHTATAYVTVGEITAALESVFGTWTERAVA